MRLSVDRTDPGYDNWVKMFVDRHIVKVFFDGIETRDVITADEESRLIVQYERDTNGILQIDYTTAPCDVKRVTRYGHVRIELLTM